jgi:hypothetical protein
MDASSLAPVLLLGGAGSLGARTARMLRRLHPELPLTIAARDLAKAQALADELGGADVTAVDLTRPDLALGGRRFSAVVTALRDLSLNSLRLAEAQGVPYLALSDAPFEIGPLVARHVHRPAAPLVLLGHGMGGAPALAALDLAAEFATVERIAVGLVFDPDDPLGPASQVDMDRIAAAGPPPLARMDGAWRFMRGADAARDFEASWGARLAGESVGLIDPLSLAVAGAPNIRVDWAVAASPERGAAPPHEVVIEIEGVRPDGRRETARRVLIDREGYASLSAKGVAVAVERLLGLAGGPAPGAGLYLPESFIPPAHLMARLRELGVEVR